MLINYTNLFKLYYLNLIMEDEQRIVNQIESINMQNFSAQLFKQELQRLHEVLNAHTQKLINLISIVNTQFNIKRLEKIISSAQNSNDMTQQILPILTEFEKFSNQLLQELNSFFDEVEKSEVELLGFKYRFLLDFTQLLRATKNKETLLLDPKHNDFKKVSQLLKKLAQRLDDEEKSERANFLVVTEEEIKKEIKQSKKHSFWHFFYKLFSRTKTFEGTYSKFISTIEEDIQSQKSQEVFIRFDQVRYYIITDITQNKISLDFIKKLSEYLDYLLLIEILVHDLEVQLIQSLHELNRKFVELNNSMFQFANYIWNEEKIPYNLKKYVKEYLNNVDSVEKGIMKLRLIEENINQEIEKLLKYTRKEFDAFKQQIKEQNQRNQTDAQELLKGRK